MIENSNDLKNFVSRPPVVVVLGHVDHGKTSLLDFIRKTKVVEKEAGEITQHIGAYEIEVQLKAEPKSRGSEANREISSGKSDFSTSSRKITFIDTPGHEAFSSLRSRGAKIADIAVLVIAGDEGIKPQTIESIDYIKEAGIPFLVAITKIDKEGASIEKVKKELSEKEIYVEGWGGDIPAIGVSSKTGEGIEHLLEMILLMAEMEELKACYENPAKGIVIESHSDSRRGISATVIVFDGTLRLGDSLFTGGIKGKIKMLEDFHGNPLPEATFSSPIRIIGFENPPAVGEEVLAGKEELISAYLSSFKESVKEETIKRIGDNASNVLIPVIIKSDAVGSSEALEEIIKNLADEQKWLFTILKNEVGDIFEGDLKIAPSGFTLVIGFKVKKRPEAVNFLLTKKNIITIESEIIYDIKDKVKEIIESKFIEQPTEEIIGKLEVLAVFNPIKGNQLIGGKVIEGVARNKNRFNVIKENEIIGEGKLINLQKNKVDVNEVNSGEECGLLIECPKNAEKGDILEFFQKI